MTRLVLSDVSTRGPALRRGWTVRHATLFQILAASPSLLVAIVLQGPALIPLVVVAIATALVWEAVFAKGRRRAMSAHGITTGMIVAVMAPEAAALWQIALAVSFGAVIGELVFGGRGFGFLNAGLAALAFLVFSFPGLVLQGASPLVALVALPGGAALLALGFISWRVIAATVAGFAAVIAATDGAGDPAALAAALCFPLIFLIADPLAASATNAGRVLYGLLAGVLAALFMGSGAGAAGSNAVIFAALVAAVFAPLLDEIALRAAAWMREKRHG